jgi:hypothetical protein
MIDLRISVKRFREYRVLVVDGLIGCQIRGSSVTAGACLIGRSPPRRSPEDPPQKRRKRHKARQVHAEEPLKKGGVYKTERN